SACLRGNVSTGVGMYKSTDAGRTWTHVGLRDAGQIAKVRIHPRNPDLVYVAVVGHAFGRNAERGVFRSRDGGKTWEKVLFLSDSTGAIDLSMDVHNPRVLYAALWRAERKPWTFYGGAMEGGIYKTTDGGDTWTRLTSGLPTGLIGKIGVAVSAANPDKVYAVVEAGDGQGGVYRSDNAGATWRRVNSDFGPIERPWYYNHMYADPKDENTIYIASDEFLKSVDGGVTFAEVDTPHGDNHDLWINPNDPDIWVEANDGGAAVTFNGGKTWSPQTNQPTGEYYMVAVDNDFPYRVYGPQQDNSTLSVPSRVPGTGITIQHWLAVGGCETGPVAVDPRDANIVYAGCYGGRITRFDRRTGQSRQVMDYPQLQLGGTIRDMKYRFQWNAPFLISRHDPNVLYHGSQYVHRSTNEGQSWQVISPDLTRNDNGKQGRAGEPITNDITGVEVYNTLFALAESPMERGVLWAGSNDGMVHMSRDNGATWKNVTPAVLPENSTVNRIDASPHAPGRAFVAAYNYRQDDWKPYVLRTDDYGATWTLLTTGTNGIPANHPTRAVREDPDRRGLVYAGTEFGMFISFNDGASWQPFQLNLPRTPVTEIVVHNKDLVISTQGRSFWIVDDLSPLHQLTEQVASASAHLFRPRAAYRADGAPFGPTTAFVRDPVWGARLDRYQAGQNPPAGATLFYALAEEPKEDVKLEILDGQNAVIQTITTGRQERPGRQGRQPLPARAGLNRFVWDLSYPEARSPEGTASLQGSTAGPRAVPGTYKVRLTIGSWTATESFEVMKDPRVPATVADLRAQHDLQAQIVQSLNQGADAVNTIRSVTRQLSEIGQRARDIADVKRAADDLTAKLTAIERQLVQPSGEEGLQIEPRLLSQIAWVNSIVSSADARPTDQSMTRFNDVKAQLATHLDALRAVIETDVARFNAMVRERGVPPVVVPAAGGRVAAQGEGD
ncbi:MAG: glycosyl hydrolase, partial [Gemmatimonadetes bacterium]|nr:glycosyl hydrolase [Gemmatimonadota bacterium]